MERSQFPLVIRQGDKRTLVFGPGNVRTVPVSAGTYFAGSGESVCSQAMGPGRRCFRKRYNKSFHPM